MRRSNFRKVTIPFQGVAIGELPKFYRKNEKK